MKNTRIVAAAALVSFVAPAYAQKASIEGVEVKTADGARQFWIQGTDVSKPKVLWANRHSTYILEFYANLGGRKSEIDVDSDGIKNVQCVWYTSRPPRVRVAFRTDGNVEPKLEFINNSWVVSVPSKTATTPTITPVKNAPIIKPNDTLRDLGMEAKIPPVKPTQPVPTNKAWSLEEAMRLTMQDSKTTKTVATTPTTEISVLRDPVRLQQSVSLDFVTTDVVQILKALAIQTNENIVVSPDVSPSEKPVKLTVSLNKVTLDDALSFVTAMAGLRYARVGSTYIVTPSQSFSQAMRMVVDRTGNKFETRVVNLVSGAAPQIRDAALKAIPAEGKNGYYEIIVPGTGDLPVMPMTAPADPKAAGQGQPAAAPGKDKVVKAFYLMVVGDPQRVEEVEGYIHELDKQIANSSNLTKSEDLGSTVIHVQSGNTDKIKQTVEKLIAEDPRAADFSLSEAVVADNIPGVPGTKVLMLVGPKSQLKTLQTVATALDEQMCHLAGMTYITDPGKLQKEDEIIDLVYIEPTLALSQVRQRFPNISVWTFAQPVTPGAGGNVSSSQSSQGGGAQLGGGTTPPASGGASTSSSSQNITGLEPMRLIVRASKSAIQEVKDFVAKIDVAPKQVALELRVLELTKEDALNLGLNWNILDGGGATVFSFAQGTSYSNGSPGTVGATIPYKDGQSHSVLATLDQLAGSRKMIARPNALISDGRSANLFVGDTVRYIKSIQNSQNGPTIVSDELKVGVKFDIDARVGNDGAIALNLDQNFSVLTGFTAVPGGGNLPQTSDRTTKMFVNMKSGETIAIGGLIQDQDRKSVSGIPFLKDLPLIGYLFSRTNNSRVRTEIVFFLTANVVDKANRANAASPRTGLANSPDPVKEYFGSDADSKKKGGK